MKTSLLLLTVVVASVAAGADGPKGFDRFPLTRSRNIFDPDRRPGVKSASTAGAAGANRPAAVTLTGTMATEAKTLAFFSSTRAEDNKIIPVHESVAGFTVLSISPGVVEVQRAGKKSVLAVGESLPIEGAVAGPAPGPSGSAPEAAPGSPPASGQAVTGAVPAPSEPSPASDAAPTAGASASPASDAALADPDEVLRRMMERRQKEMSH